MQRIQSTIAQHKQSCSGIIGYTPEPGSNAIYGLCNLCDLWEVYWTFPAFVYISYTRWPVFPVTPSIQVHSLKFAQSKQNDLCKKRYDNWRERICGESIRYFASDNHLHWPGRAATGVVARSRRHKIPPFRLAVSPSLLNNVEKSSSIMRICIKQKERTVMRLGKGYPCRWRHSTWIFCCTNKRPSFIHASKLFREMGINVSELAW